MFVHYLGGKGPARRRREPQGVPIAGVGGRHDRIVTRHGPMPAPSERIGSPMATG